MRARRCRLLIASEVAAAFRVAAIAINLYGVARALTRRATVFAVFGRRTAAGWVLTDFFVSIRHLYLPPNEFELPVVWHSTLAHSTTGLEAIIESSHAK
jgi:hypothetical protein